MFLPVKEQLARIREGTTEIIPEDELIEKLRRSRQEERPLVVMQGFDPTRPDLHIGHAVSLRKLRTFQELGHRVVFVVGDFTARVGDPSGRDRTRPMLSEEEIRQNLATYLAQLSRVLDPDATVVRHNSEWLSELRLDDVLRLTSQYTVARMLERDDFAARYAEGSPISLVEFLYPMMQAYDSVALRADVELGGTDQKFNLLLGRTLQERAGQEPQICLIMPLLRGTDGVRKMSKSLDNYVGLADEPGEMFGRTMSIPDELLPEWIDLASSAAPDEKKRHLADAGADPLAAKRWLAHDIVRQYHGSSAADAARRDFDRVHREGRAPEDLPTSRLETDPATGTLWLGYALRESGLAGSTSEAVRLIDQGAVRLDGEVQSSKDRQLPPGDYLLQKGKRGYVRLLVEEAGA